MIKAIKVEVRTADKSIFKDVKQIIKDMQYHEYKALNKCMTIQYADMQEKKLCEEAGIKPPSERERYGGKLLRNHLYAIVRDEMKGTGANILAATSEKARFQFSTDIKKGLLKGDVSLTTYKRNVALFCSNAGIRIKCENGKYLIKFSMLDKTSPLKEQFGLKTGQIEFVAVEPKGNAKATMQRIIGGIYKLGECSLSWNRKGKLMLSISFTMESPDKTDGRNILGVDIGLHNMLALAVYDPISEEYERLCYKEALVGYEMFEEFGKQIKNRTLKGIYEQGNLEEYRENMFRRRRSAGIATKLSNGGKGYKKRNKKLLKLRDKEKNFRDTKNHQLSRYVVDEAVKHNCCAIQIEDLSGITETQNRFMKNWPYYDLQSKITYKAAEKGIEVIRIDPKYTSRRCSYCGNIIMEINDTSIHEWTCPVCGEKHNRDINAAKNIALPDIESIIKEQLKLIEPAKVG